MLRTSRLRIGSASMAGMLSSHGRMTVRYPSRYACIASS